MALEFLLLYRALASSQRNRLQARYCVAFLIFYQFFGWIVEADFSSSTALCFLG